MQRLLGQGMRADAGVLCGAAGAGDFGMLERLRRHAQANELPINNKHLYWLARDAVDFCVERGVGGDAVPILAWLSTQLPPGRTWPDLFCTELCLSAAGIGSLGTLRMLLTHGQVLFGPFRKGSPTEHLGHYVQGFTREPDSSWYYAMDRDKDSSALLTPLDQAAYGGSVEMLEWLHAAPHSYAITDFTMEEALRSSSDNLHILEWLRTHGAKCTGNNLFRAALGSWSESTVVRNFPGFSDQRRAAAAPPGARGDGSSIGGEGGGSSSANGGGDGGSITAARSVAHLSPALLTELLRNALLECEPGAARWLRLQGAAWPADLGDVAESTTWGAGVVLWAVHAGCPWGSGRCEEVCQSVSCGRRSVRSALHELGCPCGCPR
jgi:hypothetical protein